MSEPNWLVTQGSMSAQLEFSVDTGDTLTGLVFFVDPENNQDRRVMAFQANFTNVEPPVLGTDKLKMESECTINKNFQYSSFYYGRIQIVDGSLQLLIYHNETPERIDGVIFGSVTTLDGSELPNIWSTERVQLSWGGVSPA